MIADLVSIADQLKRDGNLDKLGGEVYLHRLIDSCPTIAHTAYYLKILMDKAQRRAGIETARAMEAELYEEESDRTATDIIAEHQSRLVSFGCHNTLRIRKLKDYAPEKLEQWEAAKGTGHVGVPSMIPGVNYYLGGYRPGTVIVLGGFRNEGKSTITRQDCKELAKHGFPVGLFTIEDPGDIASASMVGSEAGVSVIDLDTGRAPDETMLKVLSTWDKMGDLPLYIIDGAITIGQIGMFATVLVQRYGVRMIWIDHVQKIPPYCLPRMSRNDTMATYSQALTEYAKRLRIPIGVVSQLSRESEKEKRKPRLSDLRDSGTLEQDARQVLLLYWDGVAKHHYCEIAKNNYGVSYKRIGVRRMDGRQMFDLVDDNLEMGFCNTGGGG
jgi:replicative DNA helicase